MLRLPCLKITTKEVFMSVVLKPVHGGQSVQVFSMTPQQSKKTEKDALEYLQLRKQQAELTNKISDLNIKSRGYQANIAKADQNIFKADQNIFKADQNISQELQKQYLLHTSTIDKTIQSLVGQERALKSKGICLDNKAERVSSLGQNLLKEVTESSKKLNDFKIRYPNERETVWNEFKRMQPNLQLLCGRVKDFVQPPKK
jgi:chromosome segregation ATPase